MGEKLIDMGIAHGKRTFYAKNRSLKELMEQGILIAIPDAQEGVVFKRKEVATDLEKQAAYTLEEIEALYKKYVTDAK